MLPWNVEDLVFDEARFSGVVRLFPIPELVMFPHVMQPLHIFEPRYRDMLNDALDSDGLIAMSLPASGRQKHEDGRPVLLPQVCIGRVISHHRLEDGCYNLMLLGMRRARIRCELPLTRSFRQAEVELIDDVYSRRGKAFRAEVQSRLASGFQRSLPIPCGGDKGKALDLLASDIPLGVLTDLVSFAMPLRPGLKRRLLGEHNVDRRAQLLLNAIEKSEPPKDPAPSSAKATYLPPFSSN